MNRFRGACPDTRIYPAKEGGFMFARLCVLSALLAWGATSACAQSPVVPVSNKEAELPPPPAATVVAATVNGQPIAELAVFRGLLREDPKNWPMVRKDVLNYLINNLLVDQYLTQLKIPVDGKEVDDRVDQIKGEAKKGGMEFPMLLKRLFLTETDLRRELSGGSAGISLSCNKGRTRCSARCSRKTKACSTAARCGPAIS